MTVKRKAVSGIKWTTISTITIAIVQIVKISVLARFLDKSDFGLMAIVVFILGFINLFLDMGLTTAILHKQDISRSEYSSLFWLNFVFSLFLLLILLIITKPIAHFYNEKELIKILPLMSLNIVISSIGRQFKTIEQKELNFKFISTGDIFSSLISLIVAIYLAMHNFGVYALVYSSIVQFTINNVYFLVPSIKKKRIAFLYSYSKTKPFLKIGIYQVGGQIINYFNRDLDVLIVGKLFGAEILGGYSLAKQLVFRPLQIINPIFNRVVSPILAKFQHDKLALKRNYLKLVSIVSSINIPIYLLIMIFAPLIIKILYGNGFENIIVLVRILSVYMIIRAIGNPVGSLIIATGKTHLEFIWNVVTLLVMPIGIMIGAMYSIEGVTISITIVMFLLFFPNWRFLLKKLIDIKLTELIKAIVSLEYYYLFLCILKKSCNLKFMLRK